MIEAIITIMIILDIERKVIKIIMMIILDINLTIKIMMMIILDIKAKVIKIKMTIKDINLIHIQSHIINLTKAQYKNITKNQITDSIFLNLII